MNTRPEEYSTSSAGVGRETERVGQRIGSQMGKMAESAGNKFDSAVDYMEETAQSVKQSVQSMTNEGWDGIKRKTIDYTRKEPLNALCLAIGAGILVGWATRRAR
jgi:hypothetical protein